MPLTLTRSLLVVIVPGIVAWAPWLLWAVSEWPEVKSVYASYVVPANAFMLALVIVTGSLFEGLGSVLEDEWDRTREQTYSVQANWHEYLARVCKNEPVGFRYLAALATSFYFELSMMFASLSFFLGGALLCWVSGLEHRKLLAALLAVAGVGVAAYFRWQASCSHEVLCRTRRELNRRMGGDVEQGVEADEAR